MPSTYLTESQKVKHQLKLVTRRAKGLMAEKGISQKELANYVDINENTISRQFQTGKLSTSVLIGIMMLASADQDEMERILHYDN